MRRLGGLLVVLLAMGWLGAHPAARTDAVRSIPVRSIPVLPDTDTPSPRGNQPPAVWALGKPAPDFILPALRGPACRLSQWRGRPVVLTFWGFWCTTWKEVHGGYRELRAAVGDRCELVAVSLDCQWTDQLAPLIDRGQVPYVALMDPGSAVSRQYQVKEVPTVLAIDAQGVVRARWRGWPGQAALLRSIGLR